MRGVIITNGFLSGDKFNEPAAMIQKSAHDIGIDITHMKNSDIVFPLADRKTAGNIMGDTDFVLFWDKDIKCAMNLELCGYNIFNKPDCIRICDDKALTHIVMSSSEIPSIKTIVCPENFGQKGYPNMSLIKVIEKYINFPLVVKDCSGSFGQQVHLVKDPKQLFSLLKSASKPTIIQEYIECSGRDIRIEVVGSKVIAAIERIAPLGDFRSNITLGGTMKPYIPSDKESDIAIRASKSVGADFCGVDIIKTKDGPIVCEVNSNAYIKNIMTCTGVNVSLCILRHILEEMEQQNRKE